MSLGVLVIVTSRQAEVGISRFDTLPSENWCCRLDPICLLLLLLLFLLLIIIIIGMNAAQFLIRGLWAWSYSVALVVCY